MTNLRKENRELLQLLEGIRNDMLRRGTKDDDGEITVEMGAGNWFRLNEVLDGQMPGTVALPDTPGKLPEHHKQWFTQLQKAATNGDLALMSCLDAKTMEQRSVITLVGHQDGDFVMTPIGHMTTSDNPYEAYLPPRVGEEQETFR